MLYVKAFIAGFVSTLVFHQGVLWLLCAGGFSPRVPWNMTPVPPLHVPAVGLLHLLSQARNADE